MYLRTKIEKDFGYTSTCGISTNKVLSKLVGSKHKPRNQTTLLAFDEEQVADFMDAHTLRSIPGIGFKMSSLLEAHITGQETSADSHSFESKVTAGQIRNSPTVSPGFLEKLLSGPGAERGIGARIWALLHGVDSTEVKEASGIPSQISIEDTYKGLETMPQIIEELYKLSCSLVRRMRVDLFVVDEGSEDSNDQRWMARPKTLRLAIRSWHQMHGGSYNRSSRSGPLPSFIFDLKLDIEHIAERLVSEALVPLLRRLESEKGPRWNLQLINICVAGMVPGATEDRAGAGRDIANMFKNQDEVLRPWRIANDFKDEANIGGQEDPDFEEFDSVGEWETSGTDSCPQCGHVIPSFALPAHLRYHDLGD